MTDKQTEIEAATFRRLLNHLDENKQVQNIELMLLADFCRNCLSKWYKSEAASRGVDIDYDQAREYVYKMPYSQYQAQHQLPATEAQLMAFDEKTASKQKHC